MSIIILSGHENGAVYLWENFETVEEIIYDKNESHNPIICISAYSDGVIIGTNASNIILLDFSFKKTIKTIDLK